MNAPVSHCIAVVIEGQQIPTEAVLLALSEADESFMANIECTCLDHRVGELEWFDLESPSDQIDREAMQRAARYLTLRGLLIRHETQEHWVRFPGDRA